MIGKAAYEKVSASHQCVGSVSIHVSLIVGVPNGNTTGQAAPPPQPRACPSQAPTKRGVCASLPAACGGLARGQRRRRGSARGALKGVPEAVAGSGCWAAPDLGLGQELARRIASRGFTLEERSELII
jgi:hypothetical protein